MGWLNDGVRQWPIAFDLGATVLDKAVCSLLPQQIARVDVVGHSIESDEMSP